MDLWNPGVVESYCSVQVQWLVSCGGSFTCKQGLSCEGAPAYAHKHSTENNRPHLRHR
jgi:hypothetical protein